MGGLCVWWNREARYRGAEDWRNPGCGPIFLLDADVRSAPVPPPDDGQNRSRDASNDEAVAGSAAPHSLACTITRSILVMVSPTPLATSGVISLARTPKYVFRSS